MADLAPNTPRSDGTPPGAADPELEQLRDLLLRAERRDLARLRSILEDAEAHAEAISRVLPAAVRRSVASGDALMRELEGPVEVVLRESVRRRPEVLTSVIFPVIGPAIRRAASDALARLVRSIDHVLDSALSFRGWRWRLEAWRTGRSYAEIVLRHSLVYRVEQVLLIQRPSGILLHQLSSPDIPLPEPDLVSGMLTAIREFVVDSFQGDSVSEPLTLEIGGLLVWVEAGPSAILAMVIRGRPPAELRVLLCETLEKLHRHFEDELLSPGGLNGATAHVEPLLAECLTCEFRRPPRAPSRAKWLMAAIAVALVTGAMIAGVEWHRTRSRWDAYLGRLESEDGILVAHRDAGFRSFRVGGLRDPMAPDPVALLHEYDLPAKRVASRWEAYHAVTPSLVLRRAATVLRPPEGISLSLTNEVLHAFGDGSRAWVRSVREAAVRLPGVFGIEAHEAEPAPSGLEQRVRDLAGVTLQFGEGIDLLPDQDEQLQTLVRELQALREEAEAAGRRLRVEVIGHTDRIGTTAYNLALSRHRAEVIREALVEGGFPPGDVSATGVGSSQPLFEQMRPEEESRNRRATLRVELDSP